MTYNNSRLTVLYLTYDGLTDPLGQSQVLSYMLNVVDKGIKVIIVSFEKSSIYEQNENIVNDLLKGKSESIEWIPLKYTKFPPVISTIWDVIKLNKKINELHGRFDIVHCRSYITSLALLKYKKKTGVPFIFDMRGFWADERVEGGSWNLKNPLYKTIYNYFKKKEKEFLTRADHTISLTNAAVAEIKSWKLKMKDHQISVIPTCVDTHLFDPLKIHPQDAINLRLKLKIEEDDFVLSYIGSIGSWYMLDEMLEFFKHLQKRIPKSKFLIITKDDPKLILQNINRLELNQDNVVITKSNRNEMPLHISLSSWSIFFIKPVYSKMASAPTKLAEISSMDIPVVCNSGVGDIEELFKQSNLGHAIKSFSNKEFEIAVEHIFNHQSVKVNSTIIKDKFDLDKAILRLESIYKSLLA